MQVGVPTELFPATKDAPMRDRPAHPRLGRLLDRLAAVIAISLVAVSGGLLAELNQQAHAESRGDPFAESRSAAG